MSVLASSLSLPPLSWLIYLTLSMKPWPKAVRWMVATVGSANGDGGFTVMMNSWHHREGGHC